MSLQYTSCLYLSGVGGKEAYVLATSVQNNTY